MAFTLRRMAVKDYTMKQFHSYRIICATLFVLSTFPALADRYNNLNCDIEPGKPLTNDYGPYDFTNPAHADKLPIVLGAHFTPQVEQLIAGTSGPIIGDINYTLKAIPNYHRALAAMAKYQRRERLTFKDRDRFYTADCYFRRAVYFAPGDVTSRMLYAMHLQLTGRSEHAAAQYQHALTQAPDYTELQYNYALLLVDLKRFDEAVELANKAYGKGFPLPGLKNKLAAHGLSVTPDTAN